LRATSMVLSMARAEKSRVPMTSMMRVRWSGGRTGEASASGVNCVLLRRWEVSTGEARAGGVCSKRWGALET
jgi:hypothetical protein